MLDALFGALSGESFMPHGHCYLWQPGLVWIQLLSNLAIGLAYIAIAATLVYMVRRIEDIPFKLVYVSFAVFIVTCGFTHFMDAYVIWNPVYWIDGGIRIVTAIASVGTAVLLPTLVPDAVSLARGARAAHRRGVKLEGMVEGLETMYEQTKELEQLKTDFFANVSHELRTPLQLILGPAARLAASEQLDDDDRGRVETIVRNGKILLKHVNDLLDVASLEADRLEIAYQHVDVARKVRQLAANFETVAAQNDIDFIVEVPDALEAELDPDKLESILLNLLANAFKFTPAGSTVRCTVTTIEASGVGAGGRLVIDVADAGPGIEPEEREVIFERFRQLEGGSMRRFGGTGLGLVITRDFIEMHHGSITVGEAPEGGALFHVELPLQAPEGTRVEAPAEDDLAEDDLAEDDLAEDDLAEVNPPLMATVEGEHVVRPRQEGQAASDDRPLVLVVEDNPDMNDFIIDTLGEHYQAVAAFDGREGLERALETRPDLIVSDIMMPRMSGDQMVREVRTYERLDGVPVLLLTARADDSLRVELLSHGAQDYVMKPFEAEELLARVDNQVTISRTRKLLQDELQSTRGSLERLVGELAQSRRQLERALGTARVALERAEQGSRLKSEFLGMVSHEFRTPVAALQLQVAVLQEEADLSATGKEMLSRMSSSVDRLTQLIESLLHRAAIESGRVVVAEERVDPTQLVDDIVREMSEDAARQGIELRVEAPSQLDDLQTDPQLLRLILVNLLRNALSYTSEGHVEVRVAREGDHHLFTVTDSGPGIAPEDRVRLFAPFERGADVRRRQLPGAGLGLALVRDLAETLGGKIELESKVGVGSSFRIILPSEGRTPLPDEGGHE